MIQQDSDALTVCSLSFNYTDQPIFNDLSFTLPLGVTVIRCEESRGKSTLMRLLAGELMPNQGSISLNKVDSRQETSRYRQQVFFMDPRTETFDQISAIQYLKKIENIYDDFDRALIPDLIEGLGLSPHQDKPLYMLSAGSKRKVWIAAAIASGATITLIDDLTAALDRGSIEFLTDKLVEIAHQCNRYFIFSHYGTLDRVPHAAVIDI